MYGETINVRPHWLIQLETWQEQENEYHPSNFCQLQIDLNTQKSLTLSHPVIRLLLMTALVILPLPLTY
jgi:hypothetical protein